MAGPGTQCHNRALAGANGVIRVPIFDLVIGGRTVTGSIVGTRNDLADAFALHAAGCTRVVIADRKLDEVNDSIADLVSGKIAARVVFQL